MIIWAADIEVKLDTGFNREGEVLHRLEDGAWQVFLINGKLRTHPVNYHDLPPGEYLMAKPYLL